MSDPLGDIVRRLNRLEAQASRREDRIASTPLASYAPTYLGASTAGVTTYSTQLGSYVTIGGVAYVWGALTWTNATGTGNANVSLPVAMSATPGFGIAISLRLNGVTFAGGAFQAIIINGDDVFQIEGIATNAAPTVMAVEVAGSIIFTAVYPID